MYLISTEWLGKKILGFGFIFYFYQVQQRQIPFKRISQPKIYAQFLPNVEIAFGCSAYHSESSAMTQTGEATVLLFFYSSIR